VNPYFVSFFPNFTENTNIKSSAQEVKKPGRILYNFLMLKIFLTVFHFNRKVHILLDICLPFFNHMDPKTKSEFSVIRGQSNLLNHLLSRGCF